MGQDIVKAIIFIAIGILAIAAVPLTLLTMSISIIIASISSSQIIQHEISLFDSAQNVIGESNELNDTQTSLHNGLRNLSLINDQIIPILFFIGFTLIISLIYGRYLKDRKFTSKLGEVSSIAIGICFGIMILFYTASDLTSLTIEQTTTEIFSTVTIDKTHSNQLKFLENFVLEKISQYRTNIEGAISFGLITLYIVISFIWNKIKPDSVYPHILFYIVIGCTIIWSFEYLLNVNPSSTPFISCVKVNCG